MSLGRDSISAEVREARKSPSDSFPRGASGFLSSARGRNSGSRGGIQRELEGKRRYWDRTVEMLLAGRLSVWPAVKHSIL